MLTVVLSIIRSAIIEDNFIYVSGISQDFRIIGYIIPGLIANDMQKQGVVKTLLAVLVISMIIFLCMHLGVLTR